MELPLTKEEAALDKKFKDMIAEKELQLTEAETAMDLSKMYELDLGAQANYKTKIVQNRW